MKNEKSEKRKWKTERNEIKNGREKELEKRKRKTKSKPRTYLLLQLSEFFRNAGRESWGRERKNSSPILSSILRPDSSSFSPIALADVDGHVASDEFLRRPRQRMCPAGSGFGQFERWEWFWTLLKRSRCTTVSFPRTDKSPALSLRTSRQPPALSLPSAIRPTEMLYCLIIFPFRGLLDAAKYSQACELRVPASHGSQNCRHRYPSPLTNGSRDEESILPSTQPIQSKPFDQKCY